MTKKSRYLLLLAGFITFLILAPIIVLYVRGITYDFSKKTFVTTGILAVRSAPKDAQIFLNQKLKRKSAGDIKFLIPGEYQVTLKKEGYHDWNKRLAINSGQVTWASPAFNNINLLYKTPLLQNQIQNVTDFRNQNNTITYLTKEEIVTASASDINNQKSWKLPRSINKIVEANDSEEIFILKEENASIVFDSVSGKFYDISGLCAGECVLKFSGKDLYALNAGVLYKINFETKTKTQVLKEVKAFTFQNNNLYFIQNNASGTPELLLSQTPFSEKQILIPSVPIFESGDLMVTFEKQILLVADRNLYLMSSSLDKLAENVGQFVFQKSDSSLIISHSGELDYYDPISHNLNYITRSGQQLENLVIRSNIGYAFYKKNSRIIGMELDTRDNQNQYELYESSALVKFTLDDAAKILTVLDGTDLKILKIK